MRVCRNRSAYSRDASRCTRDANIGDHARIGSSDQFTTIGGLSSPTSRLFSSWCKILSVSAREEASRVPRTWKYRPPLVTWCGVALGAQIRGTYTSLISLVSSLYKQCACPKTVVLKRGSAKPFLGVCETHACKKKKKYVRFLEDSLVRIVDFEYSVEQ